MNARLQLNIDTYLNYDLIFGLSLETPYFKIAFTRKCPLRGHILAPLEGLCAPGVGVRGSTPGVRGDPKVILAKKIL